MYETPTGTVTQQLQYKALTTKATIPYTPLIMGLALLIVTTVLTLIIMVVRKQLKKV